MESSLYVDPGILFYVAGGILALILVMAHKQFEIHQARTVFNLVGVIGVAVMSWSAGRGNVEGLVIGAIMALFLYFGFAPDSQPETYHLNKPMSDQKYLTIEKRKDATQGKNKKV